MQIKKYGIVAVLCITLGSEALAHKGYLTTYSHHVEKGELELMLLSDFTAPSRHKREEGEGDYFSQMIELKYNPTNRLALEFMWEWFKEVETGTGKFTGSRYEIRYRLFEQEVPLNPMVYVEYENLDPTTRYKMEVSGWIDPPYTPEPESEINREKILESRLILSQDFSGWNVAFNWINESDLHTRRHDFGYSVGMMKKLHSKEGHEEHHAPFATVAAIGFEFFGALGDDRRFGIWPSRQEHYFQPSITLHFGRHSMASIGYGLGLSNASDDLMRINWGWKF